MSRTNDGLPEDDGLLYAREELAEDIASILRGDEHSPEALAHLFLHLGRAIDGGLEGISRARGTLAAGVELVFPHSTAHAAAARLYRLSVEGRLRVEDDPVRLIGAAIERGAAVDGGQGFSRSARRRSL